MVKKVERLVQNLIERGILQDRRLIRAFLKVPLEKFIPRELTDSRRIYQDIPQLFYMRSPRIRRTISAPHMICIMLQSLLLEENDNLLILGAKSGYIAAIASHLCPGGEIFIVESIKELVDITRENLDKTGFGKNINIIHSNVVYGLKDSAPWQKILVTGQVEKEDLDYVIYQLDPNGGMLFAPIGPPMKQDFTQIIRNGDDFYFKNMGEVIFGPLDLYEPTISDEADFSELPEEMPPIEFKLDLDVFDKKIKKLMERYLIREQRKRGLTDKEIIETSVNLARENEGVVNIITIADHLNIEPEQVVRVLKGYEYAVLEDFGTSNIVTMIFILNQEIYETILKSMEKIKKILDVVTKMKNEYKLETIFEYINNISEIIDNLEGPELLYRIRKLKNLINSVRSNNMLLKRIEEKISSEPKLLEQSKKIMQQQLEVLEELSDHLKDLLKRFNSWLA
ncbi:MAG: hypothetical protein ACTSRG_14110 [Candidatus Helarchaeota archaeon]